MVSLKNYNDFTNRDTIWSFVFYTLVLFLVLINIYLWTIYRYRIYAFYILYLVSTLFVYLGIEGNLFQLGLSQQLLDHFIFIFLKLWVFSLILFTAKFLDIEIIAPRYYRFLKIALATILGGTLLFQIVFFSSSIQHLHFFENVLVIFWIVLIIGMLVLSAKNRWLALKYYMLPFSCFILFTILGVVNVHFQLVPINSFTFVKVGAIFEFTGYTYFITTLIKKKLKQSDTLEQTLKSQEAILAKKIDSSDFVSIFGLIESSMSSETEWDDFKAKVNDLDPNFVNLLIEKYPDLTKSEVRLLILIRVGYNQKEIASILNIDPSSVKKARTRARKKLGLEEADNLLACLRKLS
ncbi:MAG: 7TM diverse intracellular signaling domain-containing protein [Flavobacteriales bacterium]